jgi:ABC-type amino acid transport substrate-binding protein
MIDEEDSMMFERLTSGSRWLLVNVIAVGLLLSGCVGPQTTEVVPPDTSLLRVGVSSDAPPLISRKGDTCVGLEADMAKALGAYLGKEVRFVEVPWNDQIDALLDDQTDIIMSGMSVTPLREVRIAFSKPYFRTGQMAMTSNKHRRIAPYGFYGIMGVSITLRFGVVKGTTGESFVRKNFARAKKIEVFKTARQATEGLLEGKIDILIHDAPMILMLAAENESKGLIVIPSLLSEEYLAWGMRKSEPELVAAVNRFVDQMTESGQLEQIIKRWIPFAR